MSEPRDDTPVFNYVASIEGREFIVTIFENRMSQWDDVSGYGLSERLRGEELNRIISVRVSDEIFEKVVAMIENEKAEELRMRHFSVPAGKIAEDIVEMDRLFEEFFWQYVSPQLKRTV